MQQFMMLGLWSEAIERMLTLFPRFFSFMVADCDPKGIQQAPALT